MVYVACHSIVLYDRKSKKQKFLSFNSDDISDAVTSFTVGVSRKLAAVAEKGNDVMPKVHIFDFKKHRRVKTLHLEETDTSSKVFKHTHISMHTCLYAYIRICHVSSSVFFYAFVSSIGNHLHDFF